MPNRANSTGAASGQGVPGDDLARTLWATLELSHPPVALAFVTQPPDGITSFAAEVPSDGTLWRRNSEQVFFAPAAPHDNCPIDALKMGSPMSTSQRNSTSSSSG
jgi:hypothetical protein